jgi:hypothetical protein
VLWPSIDSRSPSRTGVPEPSTWANPGFFGVGFMAYCRKSQMGLPPRGGFSFVSHICTMGRAGCRSPCQVELLVSAPREIKHSMTNILVTGGAGYIGSHTCLALAHNGYTPVAFDNLVNGHRELVQWGPFEQGDVRDRKRLDQVISNYQPAAIIHFAGLIEVAESITDPVAFFDNNVSGSLTLFAAALGAGIDKLVFSSTCATYGVPQEIPMRETHPQLPINPYGTSKLLVERMLNDLSGTIQRAMCYQSPLRWRKEGARVSKSTDLTIPRRTAPAFVISFTYLTSRTHTFAASSIFCRGERALPLMSEPAGGPASKSSWRWLKPSLGSDCRSNLERDAKAILQS